MVATGVLKGYDALMNLVLDEVEELLRGEFGFLSNPIVWIWFGLV